MRVNVRHFNLFLWTAALTAFLFLCYIPKLAGLIVPFLILFILSGYKNIRIYRFRGWGTLYGVYLCFLFCSLCKAVAAGAAAGEIIRFLLILMLIPIAGIIFDKDFEQKWKIFQFLVMLKAVSVLILWVLVFIRQDAQAYRQWAFSLHAGDIYIIDRIAVFGRTFGIPRVQLRGNTLFVMAFGLDLFRKRRLTLFNLISLLAGIAAGNQAFILGYACFAACAGWRYLADAVRKRKKAVFALWIIFIIGALSVFIPYACRVWDAKAAYSNIFRINQLRAFAGADPLFGEGLGRDVLIGGVRSARYFELQTFYIYYQIGFAGLALFYVLTFAPYIMKRNSYQITAYAAYLLYTFWNPYCFDSTHIFALLLIGNVSDSLGCTGKEIQG